MPINESSQPFSVRLSDLNGVVISIGNGTDPIRDGYDFVDFPVSIAAEGLSAIAWVRSVEGPSPRSLRAFFRALADDWRGEEGDQTWASIEHDLTVAVRRTPGHVVLTFTLRKSAYPETWTASATVSVEAGEEMSMLARAVEALLGAA